MAYIANSSGAVRPRSALIAHSFVLRLANAAAYAFVWVLLDRYFVAHGAPESPALLRTILLYALMQTTVVLLSPATARLLRWGARRGMIYGVIAGATAFVVLGAFIFGQDLPQNSFIALIAILLGTYRALYRAPYAVEHAAIGRMPRALWLEVALAFAPLLAGFTLASANTYAPALFFLGISVLLLLGLLPIALIPEVYEHFSWSYGETFAQAFDSRHRPAFAAAFWSGAEGAALFLFWPIAVFLIAGGSYEILGVVFCATLLALALARALLPSPPFKGSAPLVFVLAASGWILRSVASTPFAVFLIDTCHLTATSPGVDMSSKKERGDGGSYVDEVTVLKEIGTGFGGLAMCCVGAFASMTGDVPVTLIIVFTLTALAAGAFTVHLRSANGSRL